MRSLVLSAVALVMLLRPALAQEQTGAVPLTLDDLLDAALAHDGRVLAAHAELDAYRARYDEASLSWFPVIKLEGLFGGPVGERRLACQTIDCVTVTKPSEAGDLNLGNLGFAVGGKLEGVVPLFTFGKLTAAKEAAGAGVRAGEAGILRARQEVALEVRRAFYGWQLAGAATEILEDGKGKLREAETKLLKMLEELNEEVTDRDLFKLRYYAAQVDSMLLQARQGKELAVAALRFLTGLDEIGRQRELSNTDLQASSPTIEKRESYLSKAIQFRPELKMLNAALDAAAAFVKIQEASFYPDFFVAGTLKGSYSPVQDFIKNPLLNSGLTTYDAGLALGLQVTLDIPQKLARLSKARADHSRLANQARQAEQAVGLEIDKRLSDLETSTANIEAQRKGRRAAKAWMNANLMDYGVGISNTKDLLDSLAAFAKARLDLDKAVHDQLLAMDQLKSTIGEDLGR